MAIAVGLVRFGIDFGIGFVVIVGSQIRLNARRSIAIGVGLVGLVGFGILIGSIPTSVGLCQINCCAFGL